ncbi:MAG: phospholipase D family protein [Reichenbachiella sp.]
MHISIFYRKYRKKYNSKRIYNYSYSQLFPFKVYKTFFESEKSDTSIHSKVYLIDDKIAYVGSLNYTVSGMKYNYETSVRIEDPPAVLKIEEAFFQLLHHSKLPEINIQEWGKQLYEEPIN